MERIKSLEGKSIAIVGLGGSWQDYNLAKSHGAHFDEVWTINSVGSVIFHDRTLGANALHRFSQQDELVALSILKQAEASVADHNIFNSYDQYTTVARSRSYKLID